MSYGQKKDFEKWISRKTNSNQFQDNISNHILRQKSKIQIFWISGINGLKGIQTLNLVFRHMNHKKG